MSGEPSVWVTRPAPGNAATARSLADAGLAVIAAPVLVVRSLEAAALPAGAPPDWIVFVSARAVQGFEDALCCALAVKLAKPSIRAAAVGRRTAESAAAWRWRVDVVPEEETAEGLLRALADVDLRGRRVWIPAGNREGSATRRLPEALAARGAQVDVIPVYETVDRPLAAEDAGRLDRATPGAIVFHSPSAAEAVFAASAPPAARRWRAQAASIAIGPATARRLGELGAAPAVSCDEPSDAAVVTAVTSLEAFQTWRSTP